MSQVSLIVISIWVALIQNGNFVLSNSVTKTIPPVLFVLLSTENRHKGIVVDPLRCKQGLL